MPDSYPGREGGRLPWDPLTPAEIEQSERTIAEWPPGPDREWLKELLEAAPAEAAAAAKTKEEDVARRLLKEWHDWVLGQRDPLYLPVELTPERAKTAFPELRLTRPLSPRPASQLSARKVYRGDASTSSRSIWRGSGGGGGRASSSSQERKRRNTASMRCPRC